jgi:hypothetical protein
MKSLVFGLLALSSLLGNTGFCAEPPIAAKESAKLETVAKNHTYKLLVAKREVTLKDGSFKSGDKPDDYIAATLSNYLITDLNEDGTMDIVAVIEHHGMGSGAFYELSVLVDRGGQYIQTAPLLLGDNIRIRSIQLEASSMWEPKELLISMLAHKDADSHAEPTVEKQVCYFLKGDQLKNCSEVPIVKKPALYLYPEQTTTIDVTLHPKGKVIQSIPHYDRIWKVTASKEGLIDNAYRYLFYEAALDEPIPLPAEGWSVRHDQLSAWFDDYLHRFGLNSDEARDFREYWLEALQAGKYYTIKMIDNDTLNDRLGLNISPKPDHLLRVLLHFEPTDHMIKLKEPVTEKFVRTGFVAVEWGGILKGVLIDSGNKK